MPFFLAHGLLRCGHGFAHKGQSCNGTDVLTHFKGADFVFHALFVEVSHRKMGVRVEFEMHFDVWHPRLQGFGLHTAIGIEELLTKGEEGDGTIHGLHYLHRCNLLVGLGLLPWCSFRTNCGRRWR